MPNKVPGSSDYLTVAGVAGSETYQCPNTAAYKAADTDYIWFRTDATQRTTTTAELIGYDLQRTPVKYDDDAPYQIRAILILKTGETLSTIKLDKLHQDLDLPLFWSGVANVNGVIKGNRGLAQQLWNPWAAETTALFARFTGAPNATTKALYDKLIVDLKAGGVWAKRDVIVVYCGFDEQASYLNIKGDFNNHTKVGTVIHTPGVDVFGNAGAGYIRTNYIPSSDGSQFTVDANSWGLGLTLASNTDVYDTGAWSNIDGVTKRCVFRLRSGKNQGLIANNDSTHLTAFGTANAGIYTSERVDSNTLRLMVNGSQRKTGAVARVAIIDRELYVCGQNNNGGGMTGGSNRKYNFWFAGGKLSDDEHLAEATAYIYFRDHILATL